MEVRGIERQREIARERGRDIEINNREKKGEWLRLITLRVTHEALDSFFLS